MKILCRFGIHSWKRWYRGRRSCRRCGKVQTRFKGSFPYLAPSVFPDIVEQAYKDSFPPDEIIHIQHGATPGEVDAAWRKGAKNLALYGESAIQVEPYKVEGKENDGI